MAKSEVSKLKLKFWARQAGIAALCLFLSLLGISRAAAQTDFTLTVNSLNPDAVSPGGTSSSNVSVATASGFTGTIDLSCVVTSSVQNTVSPPVCTISPQSLTASGGASTTITTTAQTTTVSYTITITATDASGSQSSQQILTVLSESAQFTITIQSAVAPSSVAAGTGAQGVVSVNPLAGYSTPPGGFITLSCTSITPLVPVPPVCSFSYPAGQSGLIVNGTPETSTLTITTFAPTTTGAGVVPRRFYALWLPLPLFGLAGIGAAASGRRSRKAWAVLALFVLSGCLLLLPACGHSSNNTSTTTPSGTTPANTYTFTIVGVDTNGVVSSNTGTTTSAGPTVTLTVTAPK